MKTPRTTPTMAEVAAAAGVSQQTVSRVLNNHPSVSANTRQIVRQAMELMQYRPNPAARALVTGNSQTIGVLVSSTSLSGPSGSLISIEQTARARGYWVSMAGLQSNDPQEVSNVVSHFFAQGVDGIIAIAQTQVAVDATLEACGAMPTVLLTSGPVTNDRPTVDIDQADGVHQAMTLLRGLGHTHIAHICGPAGDLHSEIRANAWRTFLPGERDNTTWCVRGDWSASSGYNAAMTFLASGDPPTAIFAGNDRMAFGVLRAMHDCGFDVPRDVSVVGFDDIEGSDCSIPPLTTVRQNHAALGVAAMQLLLEAIDDQPPRRLKIPPQLIVRASTGVPPHMTAVAA
ncbi:MAG: LacI family transcriptional regulator [Propionibacteriaceae bacterium]|nr:LacI family transcriptional regulator [Propionibacteriaceae bacterium]